MSPCVSLRLVNCTSRESLNGGPNGTGIGNTWLYTHEKDEAREIARTGTDAECEAFLLELERRCSERRASWEMSR